MIVRRPHEPGQPLACQVAPGRQARCYCLDSQAWPQIQAMRQHKSAKPVTKRQVPSAFWKKKAARELAAQHSQQKEWWGAQASCGKTTVTIPSMWLSLVVTRLLGQWLLFLFVSKELVCRLLYPEEWRCINFKVPVFKMTTRSRPRWSLTSK